MDNIDKLRELQNFDFHRDLESKHTIQKQTKNSYSKPKDTKRRSHKLSGHYDNKLNIIKLSLNRTELNLIQKIIKEDLICRKISSFAETLFSKQRFSVRVKMEKNLYINKQSEKIYNNQIEAIDDFMYENIEVQEELLEVFAGDLKYVLVNKSGQLLPPQNLSHYQNTIEGMSFKNKVSSSLFEKTLERSENPEHIEELKSKNIIRFTFKIKGSQKSYNSLQKVKSEIVEKKFLQYFDRKNEIKLSNINKFDNKTQNVVRREINKQKNKYTRQIETTIETFFRKSNYKIITKKNAKYLSPSKKTDISTNQINDDLYNKIKCFKSIEDVNKVIKEFSDNEQKRIFIRDLRWLKSVGVINHFEDDTVIINKS